IDSSGNIFAGAKGSNGIFKSTDNGDHWVATSMTTQYRVYSIAVQPNGVIFAGTQLDPPESPAANGVYRSSDDGSTWSPSGLTGTSIASNGAFSFLRDGTIFVASDTGGVFRSTNGGTSWDPINTGLPTHDILNLTLANDYIFAGTFAGI